MQFRIDCDLTYQVHAPTTFLFKIEASHGPDQRIDAERLTTEPPLPLERHADALGTRTLKVNAAPGPFRIRYEANATVLRRPGTAAMRESEVADIPLGVLPYLSGSRYVESELIFQQAMRWIGTKDRGYRRVARICRWVRDNISYEVGTSLPHGTTRDVLVTRTGVCRDFAHVAIALCRALNIPARFVAGHMIWAAPPPDFHALFEAWLDGQWVLFDPTAMAPTADLIRIGSGHDAADLAFATIFGNAQLTSMNPLVFREPAAPVARGQRSSLPARATESADDRRAGLARQ